MTPPGAGSPGTSRALLAAIALAAIGFFPTEEPARADHGGPHDPEVTVTGSPTGLSLQEFCAQNPYSEICGYGGSSGMMTCPYSGVSVSRAEDCPEFSGGGGGCTGDDCGDHDGEDEADEEGIQATVELVYGCVGSRATARPSSWPTPNASAPSSFQDVDLAFEDLLPAGTLGQARTRKNRQTGEIVGRSIVIDTDENKYKANSLGATYEQMLTHTMLHEYVHHLYGPSESNAETKARQWYKLIYGAPSPTSSEFRRGLHGKGGSSEVDPCA